MKDRYDFSKGKRGRVLPPEPEPEGKIRITIRLDQDIVDRFFRMAEESGGASGYQTLINAALREYLDGKAPRFEDALRRIIREELKASAGWPGSSYSLDAGLLPIAESRRPQLGALVCLAASNLFFPELKKKALDAAVDLRTARVAGAAGVQVRAEVDADQPFGAHQKSPSSARLK
jgi:uncharacterized protein (DUF4415 family)